MTLVPGAGAPDDGHDLVAVALGSQFGRRLGLGTSRSLDEIRATEPHRSFLCLLEDAKVDALARPLFAGWRYLVLLSAEMGVDSTVERVSPSDWAVTTSSLSTTLQAELAELEWMAAQPALQSEQREICFLEVAAGIARAWWVRAAGDDHEGDLLLPLPGSHPRLRGIERQVLSAPAFREVTAELAARKIVDGRVLVQGVPGL